MSKEIVLYKETIKDMATVLKVTLEDIPVATDKVTITLYSPDPFDPTYQTGELVAIPSPSRVLPPASSAAAVRQLAPAE